jgi:DNA-binding NarL/FixJ family response regulator
MQVVARGGSDMVCIRILIVDGNDQFRSDMVSLLRQQADFEVVGEARDRAEALEKAQELRPDIMLMDVHLSGMDGLGVSRRIMEVLPHMTIVLWTSQEKDEDLWEAINIGARGYLPKQIGPEGLCRALRGAFQGEAAITRVATAKLFKEMARRLQDYPETCGPQVEHSLQEYAVLELLCHESM